MSMASIVPVVMLLPLIVVCPAVDRSENVTMPLKLIDLLDTTTPSRMSLIVLLLSPLETDSVMLLTVCVRDDTLPSSVVILLCSAVAVCCSDETSPSAFVMRVVRLLAVAVRDVMFPSASSSLAPRPSAVTCSARICFSSFSSCTYTGSVMMFTISSKPVSLKLSLSRLQNEYRSCSSSI